jgi:hypothetical protein
MVRNAQVSPASVVVAAPVRQSAPVQSDLEAMTAAAPSADNPFLTRRNRIRRANFIRRYGHAPHQMVQADAPLAQQKAAHVDRGQSTTTARPMQPEYDFGGAAAYRPQGRKPATT